MTKKENKKADNSIISSYDYTYYLDGNIQSENTRSFAYDNLGRLKKEQDGSDTIQYTYDRFGNRSSMDNNNQITNYTYDLNNRLLKEISMSDMAITYYNYDDRGNLYSKRKEQETGSPGLITVDTFGALKDTTSSTVEFYSYNGLNRLEEVRKGGTTVSYVYNAAGIRTSKETVNGVKTDFLLDGANVVAETKNGTTTNYIRGVTGIISSQVGSSTSSLKYYTSDGHGNITNLMNNTGAVVKTYTYDAFGVEKNIDQNDTNPFRYCGEYYDSEIDQIYLRARYYNPSLGRFTQQDPIRDGANWYSYCYNNPLNLWDPNGKTPTEEVDWRMTLSQDEQLTQYQKQFMAAQANGDYVGMNKAKRNATGLRKSVDPNYIDNFDYTHGGRIYEYDYSYTNWKGNKITGKVYVLNLDGTRDEQGAQADKQSIGVHDFVVIDYRDTENPNMQIRSSYKADSSDQRYAVLDVLNMHEKAYPSYWTRTKKSMENEWYWHNWSYDLRNERDRTRDVDLDNDDEDDYPKTIPV